MRKSTRGCTRGCLYWFWRHYCSLTHYLYLQRTG